MESADRPDGTGPAAGLTGPASPGSATQAATRPVAHLLLPAFVGFAMAFGARAAMILSLAVNYSFDGFQRWAGRDHVLVQAWLPLAQSIITAVTALGGDLTAARLVMAFVAACATAAGVVLAGLIGGRTAAWAFLVPASFGPFLVWGAALYQEGPFLLVLFAALALALSGRVRLADVVMGLLALVRYEGWPCVVLYLAWRRDPKALVSLWGAAVWLVMRGVLALPRYAASPADFDDWENLAARVSLESWLQDALRFLEVAFGSGALAYAVAAAIGLWFARDRRGVVLIALIGLGQMAAVAGWIAGLETATHRMLVVPAEIAGVLAAVGCGVLWDRFPGVVKLGLGVYGAIMLGFGHVDAWNVLRAEAHRIMPERILYTRLLARPDCAWRVTPRQGLGTRDRHDGCEILQGLGAPRHGDGFWCRAWGAPPPPGKRCVAEAVWDGETYVLTLTVDGEQVGWGPARVLPQAP